MGETHKVSPVFFVQFYHLTNAKECGKMAARAQARGPVFLSIVNLHNFLGKFLCKFTTCIFPDLWYTIYRKRGKYNDENKSVCLVFCAELLCK